MGRCLPWLLVTIAAVGALSACSSSSHRAGKGASDSGYVDGIRIPTPAPTTAIPAVPAPTTCPAGLRATVAQRNPHGSIVLETSRSKYLLNCTYDDKGAGKQGCPRVSVSINTEPSAFTAFNRWTVETGQNAMWSHDPARNPIPVAGVGLLAEWVPKTLTFATATANTWVSVVLSCPVHTGQDLFVATVLGRTALASTS